MGKAKRPEQVQIQLVGELRSVVLFIHQTFFISLGKEREREGDR